MGMQRWMQRAVPFAAVALVGVAPMAFAQGQQLFEWNGRVDREVQIVVQGNRVSTNAIGPTEPGRARARSMSFMPRQDGQLTVRVMNGRGNVDVIQQPTAQNGFTAIVRVRDPQAGSSNYRVVGYWQPYAGGDVYNNRRNDRRGEYDRGRYGNRGVNANQSMMHWSGNVDDQLEIRIQNGRIDYRTLSGKGPTSIRSNLGSLSMPFGNARVAVVQNQGRGSVHVVQQPSSYNGYTTVLRINDPQGGYGYYDFDLLWQ